MAKSNTDEVYANYVYIVALCIIVIVAWILLSYVQTKNDIRVGRIYRSSDREGEQGLGVDVDTIDGPTTVSDEVFLHYLMGLRDNLENIEQSIKERDCKKYSDDLVNIKRDLQKYLRDNDLSASTVGTSTDLYNPINKTTRFADVKYENDQDAEESGGVKDYYIFEITKHVEALISLSKSAKCRNGRLDIGRIDRVINAIRKDIFPGMQDVLPRKYGPSPYEPLDRLTYQPTPEWGGEATEIKQKTTAARLKALEGVGGEGGLAGIGAGSDHIGEVEANALRLSSSGTATKPVPERKGKKRKQKIKRTVANDCAFFDDARQNKPEFKPLIPMGSIHHGPSVGDTQHRMSNIFKGNCAIEIIDTDARCSL